MGRMIAIARAAREIVVQPGATVVLAILLSADAALVAGTSDLYGRVFARPRFSGPHPVWRAWAVAGSDGALRLAEPTHEQPARGAGTPVHVSFWRFHRRTGAWAPTLETRWRSLLFTPLDHQPDPESLAALRRLIATDALPPLGLIDPDDSAVLAQTDVVVRRVLWSGVAHNAVAAVLLATFLVSFVWVRHIPSRIADFRHNRAWKRGRCGRCGYPVAGLRGPTCPECGDTLGPA